MATWYSDNLTGNDTTGNGTIATPYKTIRKAAEVATANDTVNVAGSDWSAVPGTLTSTTFSATAFTTSQNLTAICPVGTVISFKDPIMGDRKLLYKVTTVTSTVITFTTQSALPIGVYEIEKITTNYYTSGSNTTFENLTGAGFEKPLNIEGGWINNFTSQTGITAMVNPNTGTGTLSTGFNFTGVTNNDTTINRFAFSHLTNNINSTSAVHIGFGDLWTISGGAPFGTNTIPLNIPNTNMNLSINRIGFSFLYPSLIPLNNAAINIDNLYYIDLGASNSISLNRRGAFNINNMWTRSTSIATNSLFSNLLREGGYEVNNFNMVWANSAISQAIALFGSDSYGTLYNFNQYGSTDLKVFSLSSSRDSIAQWINPTINIDSYTTLGVAFNASSFPANIQKYYPVQDIEGAKLLCGGGIPTFADSTVYDTGTNSLRIRKNNINANPDVVGVTIKQHYIPAGTTSALTFTIRAKSTGNNTTRFALTPLAGVGRPSGNDQFFMQTFTVTNTWANYTYTLSSAEVTLIAGQYIYLMIMPNPAWQQNHVWVDSVTIS